jgi:hypothetical protein
VLKEKCKYVHFYPPPLNLAARRRAPEPVEEKAVGSRQGVGFRDAWGDDPSGDDASSSANEPEEQVSPANDVPCAVHGPPAEDGVPCEVHGSPVEEKPLQSEGNLVSKLVEPVGVCAVSLPSAPMLEPRAVCPTTVMQAVLLAWSREARRGGITPIGNGIDQQFIFVEHKGGIDLTIRGRPTRQLEEGCNMLRK